MEKVPINFINAVHLVCRELGINTEASLPTWTICGEGIEHRSHCVSHLSDGEEWTIKAWGDVSHLNQTGFLESGFGGTELLTNSSTQHSTLVLLETLFDDVAEPTRSL